MPDPDVWDDIRRVYEENLVTTAELCTRFGISIYDLRKARTIGAWKTRPMVSARTGQARRFRTQASVPPGASPPGSSGALHNPDANESEAAARSELVNPIAPLFTAPRKRAAPVAERRALVARLTAAIKTKLVLLERRLAGEVASGEKVTSAADAERDSRTIGHIIKNLEQVREYGHAPEPGPHLRGAAAKSAALASTQLADEADRIRRELGERLLRLVETTQEPAATDPVSP